MMRRLRYLLLLLLVASCASRQAVRHYAARPDAPVEAPSPNLSPKEERLLDSENLPSSLGEGPGEGAATALTWQDVKRRALDSLCQSPLLESSQLGLYVYDLTDGQPFYAHNARHRMRPASCQKVVTAVTALHCLPDAYQLRTEFRTTGKAEKGTLQGDLIVVGGMDPLVTPDELLQAAASIKSQEGIQSIAGRVRYDLSMREDQPYGWGWCWDDDYGPLSALLVNGKDGFEEKWTQALKKVGITVKSLPQPLQRRGEQKGNKIYTIVHDLDQLLEPMMKESDNIMAECLFQQTAASTGKPMAGRKDAARCTSDLLASLGLEPSDYVVADGSGLSLYNYVTPEMLVTLLAYAWQTPRIKDHLLPSLPIAGFDGTLKKRMVGTPADGNVRAKTGTVSGISSLCGYLTTATGHTLAFAIINQGVRASSMGRAFQDDVCVELCK